ncbi:MAG: carbohydrate-binding protein [Firmicutes bacterium]|nr:carbohydrate-binding protein [Bacillota bacterium]
MLPASRLTFRNPRHDHYPATYWFWHRLPTASEIQQQIREMRAGGFRTFLIQPRLAFPLSQYLSDEYFDAYRLAVQEARTHGMHVGIYDEYAWQSGIAGGRTVQGADDLREQHLFWASCETQGGLVTLAISDIHPSVEALGEDALQWQFEGGVVAWGDWQIVGAVMYPEDIESLRDVEDVTARARLCEETTSGCRIEIALPKAARPYGVTVFVAARCLTSRVPNYLLPETASRFIAVTYEPLWRMLSHEMGTTVRYAFFDQPHPTFFSWAAHHGNLLTSLPYASRLRTRLENTSGLPWRVMLLALVRSVGPNTAAMRCQFYEEFSTLMRQQFLGTLGEWLHRHQLHLTGHEVLGHVNSWHLHGAFQRWDLRVIFGLDYFGVDAYRDVTAVDSEGFAPPLSAKLGDSVARSHGRQGCMVEQYFAGPEPGQYVGRWDLTLEDLRAHTFRLQMAGARQLLFHAFYQTDGTDADHTPLKNPRFDFAPGINFEPWWPFHGAFAQESARLSAFLAEAQPVTEVALLYPLRTAWAEGPRHPYGDHVAFWARQLMEHGYGYLFIDERDLLEASVEPGMLAIRGHRYPVLILPSVTTVAGPQTLEVVEKFLAQDGLVIASGATPHNYQHPTAADFSAAITWSELSAHYPGMVAYPGLPSWAEMTRRLDAVARSRPVISSPGRTLAQWVGKEDKAWRLALFNDSYEDVDAVVDLPAPPTFLERWDVSTGEITRVAAGVEPSCRLVVRLKPMELYCLRVLTGEKPRELQPRTAPKACVMTKLMNGKQRFRVELTSNWRFSVFPRTDASVPIDVNRGWEQQGFSDYSGRGVYSCTFSLPHSVGAERWVLHLPSVATAVEVTLNGVMIGRRAWAPYAFTIPPGLLRSQANHLELRVYNTAANQYLAGTPYAGQQAPSGLLAPPYLVSINENNEGDE